MGISATSGVQHQPSAQERIAVVGLGYVGLPLVLALGKHFSTVIGYDADPKRIATLLDGYDLRQDISTEELLHSRVIFTTDVQAMREATCIIVAVPTPIDENKKPNFALLQQACQTLGPVLRPGAVVVFESTVYPGVTETLCGSWLAKASALRQGKDFKLGYSPERISPGDSQHTLERIVKVVAGEDQQTRERVAAIYERAIPAGVYRAPSIRVAEAAKVIENTQRDLNIALINEIAILFGRMGLSTREVLATAKTKWNFLDFSPGLVGGHCIGVDPYYLTAQAQSLGYEPELILAGRKLNDGMGYYVAEQALSELAQVERERVEFNHPASQDDLQRGSQERRIGVLGITFKENVCDVRNCRVPEMIALLRECGVQIYAHDPLANAEEVRQEYGIELCAWEHLRDLDALILAVPHRVFTKRALPELLQPLREKACFLDVRSAFAPEDCPQGIRYWSL